LRKRGSSWALAAVPRWLSHVPAKEKGEFDWGDTKLLLPKDSPSHWNNILTQKQMVPNNEGDERVLMVNDLFQEFPVVLVSS
jgi:maltooligosyltrehalose synthase